MRDTIDRNQVLAILRKAQTASCTCMTKTPDSSFHDSNCRYKVLQDIDGAIVELPSVTRVHELGDQTACKERDDALALLACAYEAAAQELDGTATPEEIAALGDWAIVWSKISADVQENIRKLTPEDAADVLHAAYISEYRRGVKDAEQAYINFGPDLDARIADKRKSDMKQHTSDLSRALELAANRLQWLAIQQPTGSKQFIEQNEWVDEARAVLKQQTSFPPKVVALVAALKKAILWTDEEYDVGPWREDAQAAIDAFEGDAAWLTIKLM